MFLIEHFLQILFVLEQQEVPPGQGHVPLIIAKILEAITAIPCGGVVPEIKPHFFQAVGRYFDSSSWIERIEDTPVFTQDIVDLANVLVGFTVEAVVVGATALIRTEFLVDSAEQRGAAFST